MTLTPRWKPLHLEASHLPQLLLKATLDTSGYTIHLTDFSRIWGETLTRKQLFGRALQDDCSIDPTEGEDQYKILLQRIEQAVAQQDETSLRLCPAPGDSHALVLTLSSSLPAPLPDFRWDVRLALLPAQHVETELVTPLLHHADNLRTQVQQLIHQLRDKDRVIAKITDRLDTSGDDLTAVFPGATSVKLSRKFSQREQLAKHVMGLGDFDEVAWHQQHRTASGEEKVEGEALSEVLRDLPGPEGRAVEAREWWCGLDESVAAGGRVSAVEDAGERRRGGADGSNKMPSQEMSVQDDDGFQRQVTPPHTKRIHASPENEDTTQVVQSSMAEERPAASPDGESSTEDEDDLDAVPRTLASSQRSNSAQLRQHTPSTEVTASPSRKLGGIGGRKRLASPVAEAAQPSPAKVPSSTEHPSPPNRPQGRLGTIGGKSKPSVTPEPLPEPKISSAKPRAKLGAIGGKARVSAPIDPVSAPEIPTPPSPTTKSTHRLGVIGGKGALPSSQQKSQELPERERVREARPSERKASTPSPRETSQERADRKRGELKRQLEEKAKVGAKKKRKF